ncbi:Protein of unknown function (DUF2993) [Streptoalloteichus tenebrarius]|uniref:DUF2993 domain-containing protein n=1 Tax=Streptoalloteichus tenebrarius (strain ATCC 17920 / DSM 40477 / JCM 4838 / CBS 697.72 / NBRC 16177 / NCIMB 11028 / NRRL B-12390 / A12253. 1 / ISP 5477) TaxID=1933 RepID=A0ABT1HVE0_STRSD|nr:DUF2993 domain-containing protein [Streptoalloteichus tenebrarius]MCP2259385.1 Protein of unknown function (DUF2993) [Streptoalloteichus tenebrarius]BFF02326.1 DUF2993 domain-containing protein [Streptoalloteichus tenebrarius]
MKKLVIALLVLLGLLVAADFGAAAFAEYQLSRKLRAELNLTDDPDVRVNGFPFLTQALAGDYREIEIRANRVAFGQFRDLGLVATARHVRASLSDLASGSARVTVDEVDGQLEVRANDIGRMIDIPDLKIEPAPEELEATAAGQNKPAPGDRTTAGVKLTGSTEIAGRKVQATITGVLALVDNQIQVTPRQTQLDTGTGAFPLPEAVKRHLVQTFTFRLDPGGLPLNARPTEVSAQNGALVIRGKATNVTLGGGSSR